MLCVMRDRLFLVKLVLMYVSSRWKPEVYEYGFLTVS